MPWFPWTNLQWKTTIWRERYQASMRESWVRIVEENRLRIEGGARKCFLAGVCRGEPEGRTLFMIYWPKYRTYGRYYANLPPKKIGDSRQSSAEKLRWTRGIYLEKERNWKQRRPRFSFSSGAKCSDINEQKLLHNQCSCGMVYAYFACFQIPPSSRGLSQLLIIKHFCCKPIIWTWWHAHQLHFHKNQIEDDDTTLVLPLVPYSLVRS